MKSYYNGKDNCNCSWHMLHYFDGYRLRENYIKVYNNIIQYVEFVFPGMLERRFCGCRNHPLYFIDEKIILNKKPPQVVFAMYTFCHTAMLQEVPQNRILHYGPVHRLSVSVCRERIMLLRQN